MSHRAIEGLIATLCCASGSVSRLKHPTTKPQTTHFAPLRDGNPDQTKCPLYRGFATSCPKAMSGVWRLGEARRADLPQPRPAERVKKCHKSHITQRHEGTKKKADFRSERPDTNVIQQLVRIDRLRTRRRAPGFTPGQITLLSFLVSLCVCVELVDFFTPSLTRALRYSVPFRAEEAPRP